MAPRDFNKGRRPYSFLLLVTTPSLGSSCTDDLAVESCTPATARYSAKVTSFYDLITTLLRNTEFVLLFLKKLREPKLAVH